jgi:predicted MPP superfamily phosphohydrolase
MSTTSKRVAFHGLLGLSLAFLALAIYGVWVEPFRLEIHHQWIEHEPLSRVLGNRTVVQLSDLHVLTVGKMEQQVLKALDDLKPDLIFLTGDYVRWKGEYEAPLEFLSRLQAGTGVFAVMGDYDYSNSRKSCLFCHEKDSGKPTRRHKVRFLRDSYVMLDLGEGPFWLAGWDEVRDHVFPVSPIHPDRFSELPSIILSHNPLNFDLLDRGTGATMLSGDTHGGQIWLPSLVWQAIGYEKNARYSQGLFRRGENTLFVSRGIGTSHIRLRIFRRPEIVVLHFVRPISSAQIHH